MNLRDITQAISDDDLPVIRRAFRALVDYPNEGRVAASSPGLLIVAMNRVCVALDGDVEPMPDPTCLALGLPVGAVYNAGAATARYDRTRLSKMLMDRFVA